MERPDSVRCKNCMFASRSNGREGYPFVCRFNPPIIDTTNDAPGWPFVKGESWCGRFRPKDNLTAVEWVTWQRGLNEDEKA